MMNIPNDGGWGKAVGLGSRVGHGSLVDLKNGLLGHFSALTRDWVILCCLVLTGTLCFGTGLLATKENQPSKDPLWIEQLPPEELPGSIGTSTSSATAQATTGQGSTSDTVVKPANPIKASASQPAAAATLPKTGQYIASKTGTKYYLPTCATAKRIKPENKVWFATKAAAEAAGYQPAANCKGL